MKKLQLSALLLLLVVLITVGCKKKEETPATPTPVTPSYTCATCVTTPDAKAAYDNDSRGIYKGIIVGSSGTIKFDLANGDTTLKAYMTIDGISATLTATVAWVAGASYVSPFTGTIGGNPVSITFSVDANGGNPVVTSMSIPGHPDATLTIAKETSTNLIKCFEGTAKNNISGKTSTFDLILSTSLKKWQARVKETGSTSSSKVDGTFDNNTLSFDNGDASGSATLSGDNIINGTWNNDVPENGTWEAKRTM